MPRALRTAYTLSPLLWKRNSAMQNKTIKELHRDLVKKSISSVELTTYYLERIKRLDSKINSFITVSEEHALKQAAAADKLIQSGNGNKLTGIPIAQKDIFCTEDILTTCASKMLLNFTSPYNATVVEKYNASVSVCFAFLSQFWRSVKPII